MTRRGAALLLLGTCIVAASTAAAALFWPSLMMLTALVALIVVDGRRAPGSSALTAIRHCDPILSAGAANSVRVEIRGRGRGGIALVRDEHPPEFLSDQQPCRTRIPGSVTYNVTPRHRGEAHFGRTMLRCHGPLGLGTRQTGLQTQATVKVDADLSVLGTYEALARRGQLTEMGVRAQRRRAEGTDFDRVRDAVPDDPWRFINWPATARTGHLMTTEYQPERAQPVIICLDHGRLMGVGAGALSKLDHAINAALLLGHVALRSGDRLGLFAFSDEVDVVVAPRSGNSHLRRILDALRPVTAADIESNYDLAMLRLDQWQKRRALLLIFTDLIDTEQAAALVRQCSRLRRRHVPLVITVRDPAIDDIARQHPVDSRTTYARSIAAGLASDRDAALELLRRTGIATLDADARTLSPQLVNRYLELKRSQRL